MWVWLCHIQYVNNVGEYSSVYSENGLLNTQAVLPLHRTIQLFMNLNKKVTLVLFAAGVRMCCTEPHWNTSAGSNMNNNQ